MTEENCIEALKNKNVFTSPIATPKFYSVSLPRGIVPKEEHGDTPLVYEDKNEALRAIKNYKGSRLKIFSNKEDAFYFASQPAEVICPSPSPSVVSSALIAELSPSEEKASKFRSVTSQEIVKLRKGIEKGDAEYFSEVVWQNPKYLINSGDAPTIMHEGFRYNALHVASRHKQAGMCELVLNTVQNPKFFEYLYDDDTFTTRASRIHHVTDLYLNTPDKGFCETPLHFAAKFGCLDVLKVLLAHPLCDKGKRNKYGLTAKEMICDRCPNCPPELKKEINEVFEGLFYVPVLRDESNTAQPILGKPCSPQCIKSAEPNVLNSPDLCDPSLSIKAYAGPMSPDMAREFYKIWKNPGSPLHKSKYASLQKQLTDIRLSDTEKGLERVGRKLAADFGISWHEYWPALDAWINLASPEGLKMLEEHLKNCFHEVCEQNFVSPMTQEPAELDEVPFDQNDNENPKQAKVSPPIYSLLNDKLCLQDKEEECNFDSRELNIQEKNYKISNFENTELDLKREFDATGQMERDCDVKQNLFEIIIKDILENFCDCVSHLLLNSVSNESKNMNFIFNKLIPIFKHMTQQNFSSEPELYLIHYHLAVLFHINLSANYDEYSLVKLINFLKTFLFSSGDNMFLWNTTGQDTNESQHLLCVLQYFYYYATNRLFDAKSCNCVWRLDSSCDNYSASKCCNIIVRHQMLQQVENSKKLTGAYVGTKELDVEEDCFYTPPESPILDEILDYFVPDEAFITPVSSAHSSPKHKYEDSFKMFEIFVHGLELSKDDVDMYRAIENLEVNHKSYPFVFQWKNLVETRMKLFAKCRMIQEEGITPKSTVVELERHIRKKFVNLRRNLF